MVVTPALSYPRYSSLESPCIKKGKAKPLPQYAVIPHIKTFLHLNYLLLNEVMPDDICLMITHYFCSSFR